VLTHCGDLWVRAHKEMGDAEYPDIKQDYNHVDACTMWMVKSPEFYDVIVTENLVRHHYRPRRDDTGSMALRRAAI